MLSSPADRSIALPLTAIVTIGSPPRKPAITDSSTAWSPRWTTYGVAATNPADWGTDMGHYTVPTVVEKTAAGERIVDVYSRLLSERVIYLGTEIDDDVANVVVAQLLYLDADTSSQEISVYLNSPGGSMTATMAIYDTLQFVQAPVATTCVGQAGSGAALLLAAGTAGRRSVLPHTRVLLHQPSIGGQGTISDLALQTQEVLRVREQMIAVLSAHTGRSEKALLADTERDKVFTAEQAVAYGLADRIIPTRKQIGINAA